MPDFKTKGNIILQPLDENVGHQFEVTVSSSATANDGKIGFGRSVSSVVITAHKDDDTAETTLLGSDSLSSNVITLPLNYAGGGAGRYHLKFVCTLDNSSVRELNFNRVVCQDL